MPLAPCRRPPQVGHRHEWFCAGSGATTLGMSAGSTITAPCPPEHGDGLGHHAGRLGVETAARLVSPGGVSLS